MTSLAISNGRSHESKHPRSAVRGAGLVSGAWFR
jgi:hypothetical protein